MIRNSKGQFTKGIRKDLTGKTYGRLTVLEAGKRKNRRQYWLCQCECGNNKEIRSDQLTGGITRSCGCLKKEQEDKNLVTRHYKHKLSKTRLYKTYYGMKERCYNPNHDSYQRYGGRGIKICDEWLNDVEKFLEWGLNNGYDDNLFIDRIDNDGNYKPSNCRWVDEYEQSNNRSSSIYTKVDNEFLTIAEIARKYGFEYETIRARYHKGDREDKLIRPLKYSRKKTTPS